MAEAEGSTPFVSTLGFDKPLTLCRRLFCTVTQLVLLQPPQFYACRFNL